MKITTPLLLLIFSVLSFSQTDTTLVKTKNESPFKFSSGLNNSNVILNTKLGGKWSLQNELLLTQTEYYQFIEMPLFLKYSLTEKWSLFFGAKIDYSIKNSFDVEGSSPIFGTSAVFGTRYDFNSNFFGELKFDYSFTKNMTNSALGFKGIKNPQSFKLRIAHKF